MILKLEDIQEKDRPLIGGKGYALSVLYQNGFKVPQTLFITADVYLDYLKSTGLQEQILLTLHRKSLKDMRWEEIWDTALRIRNMFLKKELPIEIKTLFCSTIENEFGNTPVVIRSSAPDEDSAASSFAGLHESYINITGIENILAHIKLVWASLWSDAALLYRQELGLDVESSAMAVVVQEIIAGDASGVIFSKSPNDDSQILLESVHGLNQGLVDGIIEPDRWEIDRNSKAILSHHAANREQWMVTVPDGIHCESLPQNKTVIPPVTELQCKTLSEAVLKSESIFESAQDMEWTFRNNELYILQSRPITTAASDSNDKRGWYLSLKKSFDNLQELRTKIEDHLIPEMIRIAETLKEINLTKLSDDLLSSEIQNRYDINNHWVKVYWDEFIPFAHGVRIFGQFYNDTIRPDDPYEFINLLKNSQMISLKRNRMLEELSIIARADQNITAALISKEYHKLDSDFQNKAYAYIKAFGDLGCSDSDGKEYDTELATLFSIVLEMSRHIRHQNTDATDINVMSKEEDFLNQFSGEKRQQAKKYLDLARVSYQIRDDDNIYLGKIEAQWRSAIQEGKRRQMTNTDISFSLSEILGIMPEHIEKPKSTTPESTGNYNVKARQLIGQAAGPGIVTGTARVFTTRNDLAGFKNGEILICDAVDPTMTFIIPLAAGIVERRGGMLIHGAIIAREYGIPCVTGVPDLTTYIKTGETITVDGYLGIVTLK